MKTGELIDLLAQNAGKTNQHAVSRRFAVAIAAGMVAAIFLLLTMLGVNPHLGRLTESMAFWGKLAFAGSITIGAVIAAARLAQPGVPVGWPTVGLAVPFIIVWCIAIVSLVQAEPAMRPALILGQTWRTCPTNIVMLSLPTFIVVLGVLRSLAPTRLRAAGGIAGLLASSLGATVYGLHCPELAAPFLGVWYVIGIVLPSIAGFLIAPAVLRW